MIEQRIVCIYCIENLADGKKYIGQTTNYAARRRDHLSSLRKGTHSNSYLQRAWNKYGDTNFEIYIIVECEKSYLDELERLYISEFDTMNRARGYNRESGGNARKTSSPNTKYLISKHHADMSGENNPMYGVKMPDESIKKTLSHPNYINRKHKGEDSHMCSITEETARYIKYHFADGHTPYRGEITDVANKYGVSTSIVSHIKNGHCWNWL